ncbi:co-chaperone GroES [Candidatus Pacearchaeota archaeon]|nr:co-chaperone GroES [Candidatus Pacearchaeota archaeon]
MNIIPLGERVLIKQLKQAEEKTKSGLILPKGSQEKKEGIIVACGEKDGKPLPLAVGDHILYTGFSSEEFELNGEKHLILDYKDIVAKVIS